MTVGKESRHFKRAASTAEGFPDIFEGITNIFGVDCDIDAHTSPSKKKFQPYDLTRVSRS